MTIWFTSDHHFGHANIIKYCNRPYNSVAHMNALMVSAWNSVVEPEDTVYYLGDFAMQPHMVTAILPTLNGTKVLIAGNHDKCHGGASNWIEFYMDAGFASVQKHLDMQIAGERSCFITFRIAMKRTAARSTMVLALSTKDDGWSMDTSTTGGKC